MPMPDNSFVTTSYIVSSPKIRGEIRALLIADLHSNEFSAGNRELIDAAVAAKPDIVLCAGDMVIGRGDHPVDVELAFVSEMAKHFPVFYANGNHESKMSLDWWKYSSYTGELRSRGVVFLNNERVFYKQGDDIITINGIELPFDKYRKLLPPRLSVEEVEGLIGKSDDEHFQILIAHNPQFMPTYAKWGADLIVSGHFHGGVMRLRDDQALVSPYGFPLPRYGYGRYEIDGADAIVSSGLGEHLLPFRISNPMELVVIDIKADVRDGA